MWQSLAEHFIQPIAAFASKGPVKGIDLAKLVKKAILLLEDAGGHVVGLTSDGASTNRSMWKELGVCPESIFIYLWSRQIPPPRPPAVSIDLYYLWP